jgi:hypothetical protein
MNITRSTLSVAVFLLVILAFRWGVNVVVQKAIDQSQDTKNPWGAGLLPFSGKPITGFGLAIQPLDMQKFQNGFLYKPNENGPSSERRGR